MKVGILATGHLGLECLNNLSTYVSPLFIATDIASTGIIAFANNAKIPLFVGNPRNGKLASFLGDNKFDIIFSINYLFLIDNDVITKARFPVNFHGSLLPKYRGRTPHVWSIINNETKTGISAHIIDNDCDTGKIILQKEVEIDYHDTGADLLNKFIRLYPKLVREVYYLIKENRVILKNQDHKLATYFNKRRPNDGIIDWNWQKERIYNWIRAQSNPYPGAFSFIEEHMVIIDEMRFVDLGFTYSMPNGLILENDSGVLVKTPNGVVELTKVRTNIIYCQKGKIFDYENRQV
jgi:methionyl-tRNA formyltransferase